MREQIYRWIQAEQYGDDDITAVEAIMKEYPWFALAHILYLKMIYCSVQEEFPRALQKHTIYVPDHKQFYRYLCQSLKMPLSVQEEQETQVTQETQETQAEHQPEPLLPGYASYQLEQELPEETLPQLPPDEEEEEKVRHQQLIERFIADDPTLPVKQEKTAEENTPQTIEEGAKNEEFFSETLAAIYIKQKLYHKAIATYLKLSLKYPEKSVYFANLIKKTKDLINNTN